MKSKRTFLNLLALNLSFWHSYSDTQNIVADYDEWFELEKAGGKTEAEICRSLSISGILRENSGWIRTEKARTFPRLYSPILLLMGLMLLQFFLDLYVLSECEWREGASFGGFALCFNLLFPVLEYCTIRRCNHTAGEFRFPKKLTAALAIYTLLLLGVSILGSGIYFGSLKQGPWCVRFLWFSVWLLMAFSLYLAASSFLYIRQVLPAIIYAQGLTSLAFCSIRRFQTFSADQPSFLFLLLILMLETAILTILAHRRLNRT